MADTKITALAAITTVDPAADVLPIVDISDTSMAASGTTKKITSNQILGAGGTATLASATITGDLTVASSILKVTGGNVGINTATPTNTAGYKTLEIVGTGVNTGGMIRMKSSDASVSSYDFVDNNGRGIFAVSNHNLRFGCNDIEQYRIQPLGIFTWYDGAGGTRMTLNSTGLGIGVTPSAWAAGFKAAQVGSRLVLTTTGSDTFFGNNFYNDGAYKFINADYATYYDQTTGKHVWGTSTTSGSVNGVITWNPAMTLDASGNLLVGKTAAGATTSGFEVIGATGLVNSTVANDTNSVATFAAYSTLAAAYRFYVGMAGTVYATNTTISAISDARFKENVQDIDVGLGAILALKPRKFDWKAGKGKDIKGDRGFIAQEFEQVFPQLVDEWKDPAPEGEAPYKSVRQDLIPVLVKAIQELTARVEALEA
jgi:hypothetical protein